MAFYTPRGEEGRDKGETEGAEGGAADESEKPGGAKQLVHQGTAAQIDAEHRPCDTNAVKHKEAVAFYKWLLKLAEG